MIGIDTNVLLRLWLNDDPAQNTHIDALLTTHGGMPGSWLVTDVVLAEAGRREPCPTGCDFTATFDRGVRKLPGVKVL